MNKYFAEKLYTLKAYTKHILFKRSLKNTYFFFLYPVDHFIYIFPLKVKGCEDVNSDHHLPNIMVF